MRMGIQLRVSLVVCSLLIFLFVMRRVRRSTLEMADAVFWLLLAAALIVVALVPQLAYWVSDLLGFRSPSNFVFACGIIVLLVRTFHQDQQVAVLRRKLSSLVQHEALREADPAGTDGARGPGEDARADAAPGPAGSSADERVG